MEHKHLIVRAEIEHPPTTEKAVEKWIRGLSEGDLQIGSTKEGIFSVLVGPTSMIAARFWNDDPTLLQLDVCASEIAQTDIFDHIERFEVLTKSFMLLDRTNNIQQISF